MVRHAQRAAHHERFFTEPFTRLHYSRMVKMVRLHLKVTLTMTGVSFFYRSS